MQLSHFVASAMLTAGMLCASFGALLAVSSEAEARRCAMINIGTPDKPRFAKDPACGTGR